MRQGRENGICKSRWSPLLDAYKKWYGLLPQKYWVTIHLCLSLVAQSSCKHKPGVMTIRALCTGQSSTLCRQKKQTQLLRPAFSTSTHSRNTHVSLFSTRHSWWQHNLTKCPCEMCFLPTTQPCCGLSKNAHSLHLPKFRKTEGLII